MLFWRVPKSEQEMLALLTVIGALADKRQSLPENLYEWLDVQSRATVRQWISLVDRRGETEAVLRGLHTVIINFQPELLVLAEQLDETP